MRLSTPETGARFITKKGKLISMWPTSASRRSVMVASMERNDSTEISRSVCRISTKRDMCVPLKLCGRLTYMLNVAMVCCSPADRSFTRTGWLMSLMPTRLMGSRRVSARPCTSSTSARVARASLILAGGGVMGTAYRIGARCTYICRGMFLDPGRRLLFQPSGAADGANAVVRLQGPPALDGGSEALGVEAGRGQAGVARPVLDEAV